MAAITVAEMMTRGVETVGPDESAAAVARRLREGEVGSLVVVDGGPAGIVTDTDLVALLSTADLGDATAADLMSAPLVTVGPDDSATAAVRLMREEGVSKLPVVEGGELVGIVTTSDLAHYVPQVVHRASLRPADPDRPEPRFAVRPETAYERAGWRFESHSSAEEGVAVGDRVAFTKRLSDEDVRSFAEVSGDTNRLHLDDEFAAGTRFGRRIAHGTLVGGLISAALARLPGLTIYLSQELSFLGPVDVGAEVTAVCEVVEELGRDRYVLTTDVYAGSDDDGDGSGGEGGTPGDAPAAEPAGEQVVEGEAVVLIDDVPDAARPDREPLEE